MSHKDRSRLPHAVPHPIEGLAPGPHLPKRTLATQLIENPQHSKQLTLRQGIPYKIQIYHSVVLWEPRSRALCFYHLG
jgi:hypothetical protein